MVYRCGMMQEIRMDKKWKILFTIPNFDTAGSGRALLNIINHLNKNYFESHISCSHSKGELFKDIINLEIPYYLHKNQVKMIPRINGLKKCYRLSRFFKNLNIDLIHSFHYGPDYSEALAAKLAGIPWVYTKKNMNWGGKSKNGWKLRSMLSSHIFFQNRDMKNLFFKGLKNISHVPRGVDINLFLPSKKNTSLVSQYNIQENEKIILTVANLTPIKGIDILIKSFNKLLCKYNFLRLFIVGHKDSNYGRLMKLEAENSPFSSKIHLTGKVDEVLDFYSIADIFVLPTIKKGEGCPVSLLEAMSCGIPPVASNVSGIKDILAPFPELLFSPGDVDSLAEKIENLIKKNDNTKKIYRKHISSKYDINIEVRHHEKIYKNLLSIN